MRFTFDPLALKRLRASKGADDATTFAKRAGLSRQALHMIERGAAEPKARTLARLATCLGVSPAAFFVER